MKGLSKSRILIHRQCPRRLWLHTYRPDLEAEDEGVTARLTAGARVGEVARSLHPHAQLIEGDTLTEALGLTQQALKSSPRRPRVRPRLSFIRFWFGRTCCCRCAAATIWSR